MTSSEIRRLKAMYRRKNASDALVRKGIDPAEKRAAENEKAELEAKSCESAVLIDAAIIAGSKAWILILFGLDAKFAPEHIKFS